MQAQPGPGIGIGGLQAGRLVSPASHRLKPPITFSGTQEPEFRQAVDCQLAVLHAEAIARRERQQAETQQSE